MVGKCRHNLGNDFWVKNSLFNIFLYQILAHFAKTGDQISVDLFENHFVSNEIYCKRFRSEISSRFVIDDSASNSTTNWRQFQHIFVILTTVYACFADWFRSTYSCEMYGRPSLGTTRFTVKYQNLQSGPCLPRKLKYIYIK